MKVTLETYRKIQEYKKLGLSKRKTADHFGLSARTMDKLWNVTEDEFLNAEKTRFEYLDLYKEFMLEQLHTCPQIRVTNLYFKLKENFSDFDCPRSAFYRYIQKLRADYGYDQFTGRQTKPRAPLPPGFEAQVDFGQCKMKDMYGRLIRVYFFCMVLSYSRMHFVYFHPEPFTTETAIRAHEYAFRYFGGRPQTIMYDQDRVFVVSENLGNIIFVPAFEEYVNTVGYSIVLCRPRDPQTKGKVEAFVKYVKENFLEGRIFSGIDSLNSAALTWLDVEANGTYNYLTKRIPREAFMEEASTLVKVPYRGNFANNIRNVSNKYDVTYQGSRYLLPKDKVRVKEAVRIDEDEDTLIFTRATDNVIIHTEKKAASPGAQIPLKSETKDEAVSLSTLQRLYQGNAVAMEYIAKVETTVTRYKNTHYRWVIKLSRVYSDDQMEEAMEHCIRQDKCTAYELAAYLIYKSNEGAARLKMKEHLYYQCRQRARELREELK